MTPLHDALRRRLDDFDEQFDRRQPELGYFLGTCVFITLTLGVMVMIDPDKGGNP